MFDNNYAPHRPARRAGWRKQAWRTLILRSAIVLPALPLLLVAGLNGNTATLITFILWLGMR